MILYGVVETGIGDFGKWIAALQTHYERKTGMVLYPGTLNVRLREPFDVPKTCCRLEADEYGGTVNVCIVPCRILGRRAFILRTDKNDAGEGDHPQKIAEIATDVRLRDLYSLRDGDVVSIEVDEQRVVPN